MSTEVPGGEQPDPGMDDPSLDGFVLRMLLGSQLRRLREAANVTPDQAGYEIRASRSKISRMETGRVGFKPRDVADLLTLYGVTDNKSDPGSSTWQSGPACRTGGPSTAMSCPTGSRTTSG